MNLRERVESDLSFSLEGDWGLPVELISPQGEKIDTKQGTTEQLKGQVMLETLSTNMETGEQLLIGNPNVSLRLSSLSSYPTKSDYRNWFVRIPQTPSESAPLVTYKIGDAPQGGESLGYITLMLEQVSQT